jgi:hypothetical protein
MILNRRTNRDKEKVENLNLTNTPKLLKNTKRTKYL